MSRGTTMSVLGLYNSDSGLFSEMVFPSGFTNDDKQTVVYNILAECAELEVLYPDAAFMRGMIGEWSKMNIYVWQKIFTASQLTYNPIENYNRTQVETTETHGADTHSGSDSTTTNSNNTETNSGTDTATNSITSYVELQLPTSANSHPLRSR